MAKAVDKRKTAGILVPACGTAGFLISAYKHVLAMNAKDNRHGAALSPEERNRLANLAKYYEAARIPRAASACREDWVVPSSFRMRGRTVALVFARIR